LYGTAWTTDRTEELVYSAVQHGFRGIDTACRPKHYYELGVVMRCREYLLKELHAGRKFSSKLGTSLIRDKTKTMFGRTKMPN
jgi:hypothetical protein